MTELTRRYVVMTMASESPFDTADPDGVFVLKPWKDPAALRALMTYRDLCYPELGRDLDVWIRIIERGAVVRGDVGRRNEPYAAAGGRARSAGTAQAAARRRPAARHARPKRRAAGGHRKKRRR